MDSVYIAFGSIGMWVKKKFPQIADVVAGVEEENFADVEEENRRKLAKLDAFRIQSRKECRKRAAELRQLEKLSEQQKRLTKLEDSYELVEKHKRICDDEAMKERYACSNWEKSVALMREVKDFAQCVRCEMEKCKKELGGYIRKTSSGAGYAKDKNVSETRKKLRTLSKVKVCVDKNMRLYKRLMKELWNAKQNRNRKRQDAEKRLWEIKKVKRFFECVSCGKKFAVTVGQLADFHERGFQPPKRCPNCRERRKVCCHGHL